MNPLLPGSALSVIQPGSGDFPQYCSKKHLALASARRQCFNLSGFQTPLQDMHAFLTDTFNMLGYFCLFISLMNIIECLSNIPDKESGAISRKLKLTAKKRETYSK